MDKLQQLNNLFLILVFFFPGFISLKVYDLLVPNEKRNFSNDFLDAVSYSLLNLGLLIFLLAPAIYFKWYENIWIFCSLVFMTLVACPVLWPVLLRKIHTTKIYGKLFGSPIKRSWDWFFSKKESLWVVAHLKDGRKIGGVFAKNSHASSFPIKEQIYLEVVWKLNEQGGFENPAESSKGIILLGDEILSLEFFENK
jgi:hypothetical protein